MESTISYIAHAIQKEAPTPLELQSLLPAVHRLVDALSQSTRLPLTFSATPRPQYSEILRAKHVTITRNEDDDQTKTKRARLLLLLPASADTNNDPEDSDTDLDLDLDPNINPNLNPDVIVLPITCLISSIPSISSIPPSETSPPSPSTPFTTPSSLPPYTSSCSPSLKLRRMMRH